MWIRETASKMEAMGTLRFRGWKRKKNSQGGCCIEAGEVGGIWTERCRRLSGRMCTQKEVSQVSGDRERTTWLGKGEVTHDLDENYVREAMGTKASQTGLYREGLLK